MRPSAAAVSELAATGVLRAAINFGNAVLARRETDGSAGGITTDIARELAHRLGVPVEFVHYDQAGEVFAALEQDAWDLCFLAIEPVRAARIAFTEPYLLIEGVYLVPGTSPIRTAAEVDQAGTRVGVIAGSAYDLFLTRNLKHASLVRRPGAQDVIGLLDPGEADVVGGVKPMLESQARQVAGSRLLAEPFMAIRQAVGTRRERTAAATYLADFVRDLKQSGFLRAAFARNRIEGASLAD